VTDEAWLEAETVGDGYRFYLKSDKTGEYCFVDANDSGAIKCTNSGAFAKDHSSIFEFKASADKLTVSLDQDMQNLGEDIRMCNMRNALKLLSCNHNESSQDFEMWVP
jgi:hypothetical protein